MVEATTEMAAGVATAAGAETAVAAAETAAVAMVEVAVATEPASNNLSLNDIDSPR